MTETSEAPAREFRPAEGRSLSPPSWMNLDFRQDHIGPVHGINDRLPVYFLTELMGAAPGLSPERLQMDCHFLDWASLLKEAS